MCVIFDRPVGEYGALVEWLLARNKPKYSEINLSQCYCAYHKFNIDWPGTDPNPQMWESGEKYLSMRQY
jgi:hypothetical protein